MKKLSIVLLLVILSTNLFAGDVATFVNLGFSPKGDYFLFGEYGVEATIQEAYANMWMIDVKGNRYAKGGVFSGKYKTVIEPGESSIGALLKLLISGSKYISSKKIDFLDQGRPLYVRINDSENIDNLEFRDFASGTKYKVDLNKNIKSIGDSFVSSFGISLVTTSKSGVVKNYLLGNPDYERKGVKDYKIERILHSGYGNNLVVVVSKQIVDGDSINIRYMVETISLK